MKIPLLLLSVLFLGAGCVNVDTQQITETTTDLSPTVETAQIYVSFIQNVHDWVFPEFSLETINRIISLHEHYEIPVDLYLDDHVVQSYLELDPTIFERFKSNPYVTISWHIRPPHPAYEGFDSIGLAQMTKEEQYETLYAYETHRLNLVTGEYTDEPGGYAYLKELIGYAPRVVTHTTDPHYGEAMSRVYEELGALFTVIHKRNSDLDQTIHGLHLRPEHQEVKLYEERVTNTFSMDALFETWMADFDGTRDHYINLKFHENNYYTSETPFGDVYWDQSVTSKGTPLSPPFDLTLGQQTSFKSQKMRDEKWFVYEEALKYVDTHRDTLTAITSKDLEQMLD